MIHVEEVRGLVRKWIEDGLDGRGRNSRYEDLRAFVKDHGGVPLTKLPVDVIEHFLKTRKIL